MKKKKKQEKKGNGGGRGGEQYGTGKFFTGKLEVTRSGMGFVVVPGDNQDILIKRNDIRMALNGDEVKVEVTKTSVRGGRSEGRVVEVIRRKQMEFSGRIQVLEHYAFLLTDSEKMPLDIFIPLHLLGEAKDGDHAVAKIIEWTGKSKNPVGEVISILTNESRNEVAMQGILMENGFPLSFPDDVLEDAARYPEGVTSDEVKKRRDMRTTMTFTIDPVDAKDFDDAISYKELKDGLYEIGVHIADVSHYIEKDSALDKEAYHRATSVYLPDRVLPMLPERLSNELCSLRPYEDKYTFSAIFQVTKDGKVKDYWLGKTVIRSQRRFSYEEVQDIIEGEDGDLKDEILLLNSMAQSLRKARFKKGAINFSSQEVRFKLDEKGKPIGIVVKESKEAHQLIEEFMLLANRTVAEYVSEITVKDTAVPFPYRVHDQPDEDKLKVFMMYAGKYGHKFNLGSPEAIAKSFNEMLALAKGKPEQHVLESLGIRTMAKAVYTTENIGHYGLGFEDYCHFTSPIRRYPDVLVHRILQECLDKDIHPIKALEQQCRHCSDQERRAMEAERAANKYKQVEYLQDHIGEDFDAVISGVSQFGFWAETVEHKCEGMVQLSELNTIDDFEMKEGDYSLVGRHTGLRFGIGDKVKIRVAAANLDKRQLDFSILELPEPAKGSKRDTSGMTKQPYKPERPKGGAGRKKDPKRKK